jgi:hypothetical protein
VSGGTAQADPGGYLFGNKFTISYGLGLRIATGNRWEVSADLTHLVLEVHVSDRLWTAMAAAVNAESISQRHALPVWKAEPPPEHRHEPVLLPVDAAAGCATLTRRVTFSAAHRYQAPRVGRRAERGGVRRVRAPELARAHLHLRRDRRRSDRSA